MRVRVATAAAPHVRVAAATDLVAAHALFLVPVALLVEVAVVLVAGVPAVQLDVAHRSDGESVVATAKNCSP